MLRRQSRLRREYIFRKSVEEKERTTLEKRDRLKKALDQNRPIPTDLREEAVSLQRTLEWEDGGGDGATSHQDDEYKWAGVSDPKIIVTTSRDPSAKLKQFAKELKLMIPNAQRMNRGHYEIGQLMSACRANEVTDFILVHEHRGVPDTLIVCHLPFGPTAYFTLSGVLMRHDIPDAGTMSEVYPHLVFNNFGSKLGGRVMNILKYLFPVPKDDAKRVLTFSNEEDYISFRHHTFKKADGTEIELNEVGPRFEMKLYCIKLGTLESIDAAETEWVYRPYMNTTHKRQFLAAEPEEDE